MDVKIKNSSLLRGVVQVPGDKSISHRAVMLGALARGTTEIHNFLSGVDCLATARLIAALGVSVEVTGSRVVVQSPGLDALAEPTDVLDAGNSGTTMRLLAGILAGCPFFGVLTGDDSLRQRPMARIIQPLTTMGAVINARGNNRFAPLAIRGGNLSALSYTTPVASAQVKSAILLAGLFASGPTTVTEPAPSRDHTERLLRYMGARVEVKGTSSTVWGRPRLRPGRITIPGDISSAMFFVVAALIVPGSRLLLPGVGINPTRTGALDVLQAMGARIYFLNRREVSGEPVADIRVESSRLTGTNISGSLVPRLIDEIPVLAVAAALAEGETVITDAGELRYKETDRIATVVDMLTRMGAEVEARPDGLRIGGGGSLQGTVCPCHGDHRLAMAAAVAGLVARGETVIQGARCVEISYPLFFDSLNELGVK